jgi:hypothetical protein
MGLRARQLDGKRWLILAGLTALGLTAHCASLLGVRDFSTSAEGPLAADAGDAVDGADPWGCLDRPNEVLDPGTQVRITLQVYDGVDSVVVAGPQGGSDLTLLSYTPIAGMSALACNTLDLTCLAPLAPLQITDDAGEATLDVPESFVGFFEFTGAGYVPSRVYPDQLLVDASVVTLPIGVPGTPEQVSLLASSIHVPIALDPDAGAGTAIFTAYDCFDRYAGGIAFNVLVDAGPQTVPFYIANGLPSVTATTTDSFRGSGGVANIPVGEVTVTATLAETKRLIGSVDMVITPGWVSFAWFRTRTH